MDIIIPLAKDKSYIELRYTLRSIAANFTHRNIIIVGEKPNWIANVTHIPLNDIHHRKAFSIFRKIRTAAKSDISDNFVSWSDDTYLLKPIDKIYDWYDNTLHHWAHLNINSGYREIIKNTWKLFPDGLFYNVHTPCVYNKQRFIDLAKYNWNTQYLIKSLYFNSGESSPVEMKEPKRHPDLFASSNGAVPKDVLSLFTNPSRYEIW